MSNLKIRRRLTYLTIGVFFFLGGVEYAVVLPTLWLFMRNRFDSPAYMFGLVLSAFSFSGLLAAPVMGKWSDVTKNTKYVILFANIWEIAGSIMYFMGLSQWFVVAARLVAGVGTGVGAAIIADITRVTSSEDRTGVISTFMAIRQFGLLIGPAFNLFLREFHFYLGPFLIDKYTSPGLFMACLWLVLQLMVLCFYWNLPALKHHEQLQARLGTSEGDRDDLPDQDDDETSRLLHQDTVTSGPELGRRTPPRTADPRAHLVGRQVSAAMTPSSILIEAAEIHLSGEEDAPRPHDVTVQRREQGSGGLYDELNRGGNDMSHESQCQEIPQTVVTAYGSVNSAHGNEVKEAFKGQDRSLIQLSGWRYYSNEFIREEIVALLAAVFVSFFSQMCIETLATPFNQMLLGWGELGNSLIYCVAGLEIILVFILIRVLSRCFSDRQMLLAGFVIELLTVIVLLWYIPQAPRFSSNPDAARINLPWLIVLLFFDVFALPFISVCSISLYSKLTSENTQGFAQGVRRMSGGLACILGPLWSGSLLDRLYILYGVMAALMILVLIMLLLSFKRLKPLEKSNT